MDNNIIQNSEIRFGVPVIKETRITVSDILNYLAGGDTVETLIENFPELTKEKIQFALKYASNLIGTTSYSNVQNEIAYRK